MIAPWMPVSSATSRTAACSAVSPASRCPFGSDHSSRPRRFVRPISAPIGTGAGQVEHEAAGAGLVDSAQPRPSGGRRRADMRPMLLGGSVGSAPRTKARQPWQTGSHGIRREYLVVTGNPGDLVADPGGRRPAGRARSPRPGTSCTWSAARCATR